MSETIIIGDLHLDKIRKVTYGEASLWNERPFKLLETIIKKESPKNIIFLGDIFDKHKPDSLSVVKFLALLKGINIFIVEGNHDRPKMEQDYCFQELDKLGSINIISRNEISCFMPNFYGLGWCDTQEMFLSKLELVVDEIAEDSILCLHCNHSDWRNEMDNYIPNSIIEKLDDKGVTIFAGHDHSHFVAKNFISLGSIMPNNIGELGEKKYWTIKDGLINIDHRVGTHKEDLVLLLREEPVGIIETKAYYIKSSGTIDTEDLKLQAKDLHVDILADFNREAQKAGYDLEYVSKFLGGIA